MGAAGDRGSWRQAAQQGRCESPALPRDLRDRGPELELQRRVYQCWGRKLSDQRLDLGDGPRVIDPRRDASVRVHAVAHVNGVSQRRLRATAPALLRSTVDRRDGDLVGISVARVRDQGFDVEEAESQQQQEREQMAGEARAKASHRAVFEARRRGLRNGQAAIDLSGGTL